MGDFAQGIKAFKKGMAEDDAPAEKKAEPAKAIDHQAAGTAKTDAERHTESVRS
jgi:sec-independent protein translocase protein TatA